MFYFAYGSNLDQEQIRERCPDSTLIGVGCLRDFKIGFTWYSAGWAGGVADVIPCVDSEVWGLVYRVTEADLESLDEYEGYPKSYTRRQLPIVTVGQEINAWVYEVVKKSDFIRPTASYLGIMLKAAQEHGFPQKYRNLLETFQEDLHG